MYVGWIDEMDEWYNEMSLDETVPYKQEYELTFGEPARLFARQDVVKQKNEHMRQMTT